MEGVLAVMLKLDIWRLGNTISHGNDQKLAFVMKCLSVMFGQNPDGQRTKATRREFLLFLIIMTRYGIQYKVTSNDFLYP